MADNKKGFILYADQKELFDQLPDDKAGQLIKHIFAYVNDENPQTDDLYIKLAFTPIKQQFKRDLDKWETTKQGRSKAGKASVEARRNKKQQELTNSTNVKSVKQELTNSTVTVNDNVNVTVTDNVKVKVINKVKNSDSIEQRKLKFADTLKPFIDKYGKELIKDFYLYWTEPNKSNTRFKQELLKTWSAERRLSNWNKNDFNKTNNGNKQLTATEKNQRDSDESTKRLLERVQQDFDNQQGI